MSWWLQSWCGVTMETSGIDIESDVSAQYTSRYATMVFCWVFSWLISMLEKGSTVVDSGLRICMRKLEYWWQYHKVGSLYITERPRLST